MARSRAGERLVLVVDDDPDILQTLGLCLSSEGYRVMMPVMDGWQFVAELEHRGWRDMPLLILSADRSVQGHAKQLRANAHLAKPFDLDELLGKVQQLMGGALPN